MTFMRAITVPSRWQLTIDRVRWDELIRLATSALGTDSSTDQSELDVYLIGQQMKLHLTAALMEVNFRFTSVVVQSAPSFCYI